MIKTQNNINSDSEIMADFRRDFGMADDYSLAERAEDNPLLANALERGGLLDAYQLANKAEDNPLLANALERSNRGNKPTLPVFLLKEDSKETPERVFI